MEKIEFLFLSVLVGGCGFVLVAIGIALLRISVCK